MKKIALIIIVLIVVLILGGIYMFFSLVDKSEPKITILDKEFICQGMTIRTDQKKMMKDLPKLYSKYMDFKNQKGIPNMVTPWEYISLSDNFNSDLSFDYHTGYVVSVDQNITELEKFSTPKGIYAIFRIRGKNKLTFGLAMGFTKRFIYQDWLIKSKYEFAGYEFEYNNESMNKINPYDIDLYVSLKEKSQK
jgi:predicted transcriptional regulator YdeE